MMPINKPNHPNLTAPIPKFSILSVISPPEAMEYKNAPTKTIPNAGASKNTPKFKSHSFPQKTLKSCSEGCFLDPKMVPN